MATYIQRIILEPEESKLILRYMETKDELTIGESKGYSVRFKNGYSMELSLNGSEKGLPWIEISLFDRKGYSVYSAEKKYFFGSHSVLYKSDFYLVEVYKEQQTQEILLTSADKEAINNFDELSEDDTITYTAKFNNNYTMDVKVCGSNDGDWWTEAVLFNEKGWQLSYSEPDEYLTGLWELEDDNILYSVEVKYS